jgi:hypothetical protein
VLERWRLEIEERISNRSKNVDSNFEAVKYRIDDFKET